MWFLNLIQYSNRHLLGYEFNHSLADFIIHWYNSLNRVESLPNRNETLFILNSLIG